MVKELESQIKGVFNPNVDNQEAIPEKVEEVEKPYVNFKPDDKQVEEDWKNNANHGLRKKGSNNRVVNMLLLKSLFILAIIIGVGFFSWGIYNDKFKTSIVDNSTTICEGSNLNVTIPESVPCPACPSLDCGNTNVTINPLIYSNSS